MFFLFAPTENHYLNEHHQSYPAQQRSKEPPGICQPAAGVDLEDSSLGGGEGGGFRGCEESEGT